MLRNLLLACGLAAAQNYPGVRPSAAALTSRFGQPRRISAPAVTYTPRANAAVTVASSAVASAASSSCGAIRDPCKCMNQCGWSSTSNTCVDSSRSQTDCSECPQACIEAGIPPDFPGVAPTRPTATTLPSTTFNPMAGQRFPGAAVDAASAGPSRPAAPQINPNIAPGTDPKAAAQQLKAQGVTAEQLCHLASSDPCKCAKVKSCGWSGSACVAKSQAVAGAECAVCPSAKSCRASSTGPVAYPGMSQAGMPMGYPGMVAQEKSSDDDDDDDLSPQEQYQKKWEKQQKEWEKQQKEAQKEAEKRAKEAQQQQQMRSFMPVMMMGGIDNSLKSKIFKEVLENGDDRTKQAYMPMMFLGNDNDDSDDTSMNPFFSAMADNVFGFGKKKKSSESPLMRLLAAQQGGGGLGGLGGLGRLGR